LAGPSILSNRVELLIDNSVYGRFHFCEISLNLCVIGSALHKGSILVEVLKAGSYFE
jgi:hypothetical protein